MERNTEYDPFAAIYNRYWGRDYRAQAFPLVEKLLLSRLPAGSEVLDVCCGTGQFTAAVKELGFSVAGIDASSEMIRFARKNAPDVDFTVADAREFSLRRKFDAAYSVFESLNHVPDLVGLENVFSRIREHLKPRASFLFDLVGEDGFRDYWNETHAIVDTDHVCVMQSQYDEETHTGTCHVTAFLQADTWTRSDFVLKQACHDLNAAHELLSAAGFSDVTLYDAHDAGMTEETGYDRTFVLATAR
jgi:SAM-dependent methyltransferase